MKGYLKSSEGVFQLAPKVTTIGREGCDLVLQCTGVDFQHAVIEYSEAEDCFVLQDLNTAYGTYVNDCRVQNAVVRLAPCDRIRFGCDSLPYELDVENTSQVTNYPPVNQRPAWNQPLTMISDAGHPAVLTSNQTGLPYLRTVVNTTATWDQPRSHTTTVPHPPNMRARPLSASHAQRGRSNFQTIETTRAVTGPGWVGSSVTTRGIPTRQEQNEFLVLQEKEQKIMRLTEEINRLRFYESESDRKEQMIKQLRDEITELQQHLRRLQTSQSNNIISTDADVTQKILMLEGELTVRNTEVRNLKELISRHKMDSIKDTNGFSRQDYNDRITEINSIHAELERVKKDKNITSGLVTQMQRDMSNKDSTISRLTREIEVIKKEIREKDVQLSALQSKFQRVTENKQSEEEKEARDKEIATLQQKFKDAEKKVTEQTELISSLKQELDKVKASIFDEKEGKKKMKSELNTCQAQLTDIQRTERAVRVDLEQISKKLERFRNRVVQITYSTPGIRAPDSEINDDDLLDQLKKVVDERTDLAKKVKDLQDHIRQFEGSRKQTKESASKLKTLLTESGNRLKDGGRLSSKLRQEMTLMESASVEEESLMWVKDCVIALLQSEVSWQQDIEKALETCGVNIKISEDDTAKHILHLYSEWEASLSEKSRLASQLSLQEEQHRLDMTQALDNLREDMQNNCADAVEKAKLEGEEKLNQAIDEIRAVEEEKRENAVHTEKVLISELEMNLETLRQSILEREQKENGDLEAAKLVLVQLEEYKKIEAELCEEIENIKKAKEEEIYVLQKDIAEKDTKLEQDVISYREQIQQHLVTICAMEERLNKVVKKNKDYQAEITTLKQTITDLKKKPSLPPKPNVKVIHPEVAALEQLVVSLRREIVEYKKTVQDQQDVILGLRRDLAGASARLTDMTGELSEVQKEEMERMREKVREQEAELTELRQQLVKLSQIVDKQAAEIKETSGELSKYKATSGKLKNSFNEKDHRIKELESQLSEEIKDKKKQISLMQEEGRITSELTALGAQCRGERHDQVITRQREALTELRGRIKSLEQVRPPLPTHDQALQQVVLLKKDLAEIRANQAMADDPHIHDATMREVNRARGLVPHTQADSDIERSAHRETLESLELSETSFLSLLRGVASSLELEDISGLRSMAHIPKDERQQLFDDRDRACELLTSRIKVLKERIARKDELLAGYERDLAKLRQAESLAEHKQAQVESLATDVRSRTEETQYLRESLQRTRDKLEQEKRFNSAVKNKKVHQLEAERPSPQTWPRHHCPQDDILNKVAQKKRVQNERIKRKNYEIHALKTELSTKQSALQSASRKVFSLESSLGLQLSSKPSPVTEVVE